MAYVSLRVQPGPGGLVRQPGDHMPEADKWPNPKLWVSKGYVRWVPAEDIVGGRWKDFQAFASSGAGGQALRALALHQKGNGAAAPPAAAAPPPPKDERPVARLPLLDEYVAAGYEAGTYEEFIRQSTAKAEAKGFMVEVRAPTAEEVSAAEARESAAVEAAPPDPMPGPDRAAGEEAARQAALSLRSVTHPENLPPLSKKDLEPKSQAELLTLARARGLDVEDGTGKGKLIKLLLKD